MVSGKTPQNRQTSNPPFLVITQYKTILSPTQQVLVNNQPNPNKPFSYKKQNQKPAKQRRKHSG